MPVTTNPQNLVLRRDIDTERGFAWDANRKMLWVNLTNLVDGDFLQTNPVTGLLTFDVQKLDDLKADLKALMDLKDQGIKNHVGELDRKLKAFGENLQGFLQELASNGNPIHTASGSGLTGEGTRDNPLGLDFSRDDFQVIGGKLQLKAKEPAILTDLNKQLKGIGFNTFSGVINNTNGARTFIAGVPREIESEAAMQLAAEDITDLALNQNYDFNGYYIASEHEVVMTLINGGVTWTRSNESGVAANGKVKNPNDWTQWKRETNLNISVELVSAQGQQLQALQTAIQSLQDALNTKTQQLQALQTASDQRVQALQTRVETPCAVTLSTVTAHTVVDTDSTIVSTGGTITIPTGLTTGRMFTVIQGSDADVTIAGGAGMTLTLPFEGGAMLAGNNAIASILITGADTARVFGQTKGQ